MTPGHGEADRSAWAVGFIFLRLGLTCFGGPVAHLGYFREEFVVRRQWLSEASYAQLVALCQFLPGPASSQVGFAIGLGRAGYAGALAAWAGFTLPSALALIVLATGISGYPQAIPTGALDGLKLAAVAVVAQAVWGMGRSLCAGRVRIGLMLLTACFVLWLPTAAAQITSMGVAALIGMAWLQPAPPEAWQPSPIQPPRRAALACLGVFFTLLLGLPVLNALYPSQALALIDAFYRAGALVFGGGHVVLPLLQAEVVLAGWVGNDAFMAGYGLAQAVPGPLFTFAAFLGASMNQAPSGWLGGVICLLAIFTPACLLVTGALPLWAVLQRTRRAQAALMGANAAVVGLLLAAFWNPVCTSAIRGPSDVALVVVVLVGLMAFKLPPWLVVLGSGVVGGLLAPGP